MRHITSRMAAIIALLCIGLFASAQKDIPPPAERAASITEWMKTNLQLTEEQVPKVETINLKYANLTEDLRTSTAGKKQKMKTLKQNDQAKDAELKLVLTESQYKTYTIRKNEIKEKVKEKAKAKKSG